MVVFVPAGTTTSFMTGLGGRGVEASGGVRGVSANCLPRWSWTPAALPGAPRRGWTITVFAVRTSIRRRIAPLWQGNRLNDFAVTPVDGWARWPQRVFNAYTTRFMAVASFDRVLTETFLRVLQGVDSGPALVTPGGVARVAAGTRRRARHS